MSFKYVAAGVALVIAGIVGYVAWGAQQTKAQHRAITAIVTEASGTLASALKQPAPGQAAQLQAAADSLQSLATKRQRAYAEAADVYLVSARTIAQRQADIERMSKVAADARGAFAAQLRVSRGRSDLWMRQLTDVQKRMDDAHHDLQRVQEALVELLRTLPEAENILVPYAGSGIVIDPKLHEAAMKRAQEDLKRSAQEADTLRRHLR